MAKKKKQPEKKSKLLRDSGVGIDMPIHRRTPGLRENVRENGMNAKVYREKNMLKESQDAAGIRMEVAKRNIKPDIMHLIKKYKVNQASRKYLSIV